MLGEKASARRRVDEEAIIPASLILRDLKVFSDTAEAVMMALDLILGWSPSLAPVQFVLQLCIWSRQDWRVGRGRVTFHLHDVLGFLERRVVG